MKISEAGILMNFNGRRVPCYLTVSIHLDPVAFLSVYLRALVREVYSGYISDLKSLEE